MKKIITTIFVIALVGLTAFDGVGSYFRIKKITAENTTLSTKIENLEEKIKTITINYEDVVKKNAELTTKNEKLTNENTELSI